MGITRNSGITASAAKAADRRPSTPAIWVTVVIGMYLLAGSRAARTRPTLAAVAAIRADARGAPCDVIGRRTTQLQWYSGCVAILGADLEALARRRVYLVHEPGQPHQPELGGRPGVPRAILERPDLTVLRYDLQ